MSQKGQHAIIYGERGVGKTSLANVLRLFFPDSDAIITPRYNCSSVDTLDSIWRTMLADIDMTSRGAGFLQNDLKAGDFSTGLPEVLTPDALRRAIGALSRTLQPIFIIDEFDRLADEVKRSIADLIKSLSDHAVVASVILVGVADSVDQLIHEHHSVERALIQVHMPRMSNAEVTEIVNRGLARLNLQADPEAIERIVLFSQGLPHYAHLISLSAVRQAVDSGLSMIARDTVDLSIDKALNGVQMSIRSAWTKAVSSPRRDNLFSEALLACALARTDELGFFAARMSGSL